jgi:hypothetical protein
MQKSLVQRFGLRYWPTASMSLSKTVLNALLKNNASSIRTAVDNRGCCYAVLTTSSQYRLSNMRQLITAELYNAYAGTGPKIRGTDGLEIFVNSGDTKDLFTELAALIDKIHDNDTTLGTVVPGWSSKDESEVQLYDPSKKTLQNISSTTSCEFELAVEKSSSPIDKPLATVKEQTPAGACDVTRSAGIKVSLSAARRAHKLKQNASSAVHHCNAETKNAATAVALRDAAETDLKSAEATAAAALARRKAADYDAAAALARREAAENDRKAADEYAAAALGRKQGAEADAAASIVKIEITAADLKMNEIKLVNLKHLAEIQSIEALIAKGAADLENGVATAALAYFELENAVSRAKLQHAVNVEAIATSQANTAEANQKRFEHISGMIVTLRDALPRMPNGSFGNDTDSVRYAGYLNSELHNAILEGTTQTLDTFTCISREVLVLGYKRFTNGQLMSAGKLCAADYRARYHKSPSGHLRYVDNAAGRLVNSYNMDDIDIVHSAIRVIAWKNKIALC